MNIPSVMNRQIAKAQDQLLGKLLTPGYARKVATRPMYSSLSEWINMKSGENVLELGCGPGKFVAMLSALGFKVTGVDPFDFPSWSSLKRSSNVSLMSNIVAESLPFEEDSFDQSVCLGALLYFRDPDVGLQELRRVTKPGGRVVIRNVNKLNRYTQKTGKNIDPSSRWLFTEQELTSLLERNGFTVKNSFTHGYWPSSRPVLWWYFDQVWLPDWFRNLLSWIESPGRRINITIFATA